MPAKIVFFGIGPRVGVLSEHLILKASPNTCNIYFGIEQSWGIEYVITKDSPETFFIFLEIECVICLMIILNIQVIQFRWFRLSLSSNLLSHITIKHNVCVVYYICTHNSNINIILWFLHTESWIFTGCFTWFLLAHAPHAAYHFRHP